MNSWVSSFSSVQNRGYSEHHPSLLTCRLFTGGGEDGPYLRLGPMKVGGSPDQYHYSVNLVMDCSKGFFFLRTMYLLLCATP